MTDWRLMRKHYARGVIDELHHLGYSEKDAKKIFLRHYRDMKRIYSLSMNVHDFANMIDEFERAINRKWHPDNPSHIYVGQMRDQLLKTQKNRLQQIKYFKFPR